MRILLILLLLATPALAQEIPLSDKELTDVRELLSRKDELKDIADTINYEKLPLEIEMLRAERDNLISARDADLVAEDVKNNAAKQTIIDDYEVLIDAKEAEINTKQSQLNSLTP